MENWNRNYLDLKTVNAANTCYGLGRYLFHIWSFMKDHSPFWNNHLHGTTEAFLPYFLWKKRHNKYISYIIKNQIHFLVKNVSTKLYWIPRAKRSSKWNRHLPSLLKQILNFISTTYYWKHAKLIFSPKVWEFSKKWLFDF